jgi:Type VI secretion system/phage-baseplate injector OB domain
MHTSADGNKDKPIYGFMRGIVIKNSDPMNRGRVKVFLPMLARQLLTSQGGEGAEWCLRFPGDKIFSDGVEDANQIDAAAAQKIPDDQLHRIAGVLDWVEQASPLVGAGTIGVYDATNKMADISDAPYTTDAAAADPTTASPGRTPRLQAIDKSPISSSVEFGKDSLGTGQVDMHSFNRPTAGYINSAKGMFSVPRVGAHVWVFFEGGDITRPVYFAYSYGQAEWSSIQVQNQENPDIHTPSVGLKENDPASSGVHTGKTVWNEKGGVIEFINTDDFESIKVADYYGSHITMDKLGITESTAPNKGKKLEVNGDYYVDVKGNYILRIQGERQTIIQGYDHLIYGNLADVELQQKWLDTAAPVLKNAAQRAAPPNFQQQQQTIHESSVKKAPNNDFDMPTSLDFKVPPGKTISQLNDSVKGVMKSADGATNLTVKSMTDILSNASGMGGLVGSITGAAGAISGAVNAVKSGVNSLLSGATGLLTGALGKAAGAINDHMSLSTAQLGDPLKTLGISKKIPSMPQLSMPSLPSLPSISLPQIPKIAIPSIGGIARLPGIPGIGGTAGTPNIGGASGVSGGSSSITTTMGPPYQHDAKTQQILRNQGKNPEDVPPDTAAYAVSIYERSAKSGVALNGKNVQLFENGAPLNGPDGTGHTYKNGWMVN